MQERIQLGEYEYKMPRKIRKSKFKTTPQFLPEEGYTMTNKDIAERNQGKMSYSLNVLKYVEKSFREIFLKQKHANALIPVTKLYREKVIEVVDDFVYFNQALLDV